VGLFSKIKEPISIGHIKIMLEKYFYENYRSIVVLANPKTVLNDRHAKKEI